jgi:hypothetical protein
MDDGEPPRAQNVASGQPQHLGMTPQDALECHNGQMPIPTGVGIIAGNTTFSQYPPIPTTEHSCRHRGHQRSSPHLVEPRLG